MGVDAQMFVRTMEPISDDEIRRFAYVLAAVFPGSIAENGLNRIEEISQPSEDILPMDGETFIQVNLTSRYYGPGYRRGDISGIIAIAEWLGRYIPGASIWYGGTGIHAKPFGGSDRESPAGEMGDEFQHD